jgi:hypothetical protein
MLVYNSDAPSARPSEFFSPEKKEFSPEEKKIVENDLQLQIISQDLAKKEELIRLMRLNPQIFEATDNTASRSNYLKGLGY